MARERQLALPASRCSRRRLPKTRLVVAVVDAGPPAKECGAIAIDPSLKKGIQRISATEFNIDRGVVDKILENQAELMRQARIVPEQENGKTVGIRMFGIRPETLLGVLGMENGDRLQTINGFDMTSPEKALEAYASTPHRPTTLDGPGKPPRLQHEHRLQHSSERSHETVQA